MYNLNDTQRATSRWYVAHCKHQKEGQAGAALEEYLGLTVYLPEVRRRLRGQVQRAPFFPGYLFVRANLQIVALSRINSMPGIVGLVAFDTVPQPIPIAVVEEIHRQVEHLNSQGGLVMHSFQPGDTLRLKDGPFRGLGAIFLGPMESSERVRVLIEFLGGLRKMEVGVDQLERGTDASATRPPRRTRGRGRLIRRAGEDRDETPPPS